MTETDPQETPPSPAASAAAESAPRANQYLVAGLFLLIVAVIVAAAFDRIGPRLNAPPVIGPLPAFELTRETGEPASPAAFAGDVLVFDFFFTRCRGACPLMTQRMRELQAWIDEQKIEPVRLVSISVDPEHDTPDVLREYGATFGAHPERWTFLTGSRADIWKLAVEGFRLEVTENPDYTEGAPNEEPILHSNRFVLADRAGTIRGYYNTDDPAQMKTLRDDIRLLAKR